MRVPGALVRHHRRVDGARDFGEMLDAFDRLFEIDQIVFLHAPVGADRLGGGAVALVGVAAQRDAWPDRFADPAYHLDIAVGIDADLDLDRADTLARDLRDLALRFLEAEKSDGVGDGNFPSHRAAQKTMHRQAPLPARKIIGRELDRRLGVRIALDDAVHTRMQFADFARHAALHRRREMACDDLDGGPRAFPEIAAELAAPILQRRRLAPAGIAGGVDHLHQHVAADRLGEPRPFVLAARRQRDVMKLDGRDGGVRHAASRIVAALTRQARSLPPS